MADESEGPTRVNRVRRFAFLAQLLLILFLIVWPVVRVRQLENSFARVQQNEPKDGVAQAMGRPWKDEACGDFLGNKPADCAEEFVYANPYAPYMPEYWIVSFNSNRRVIDTYYTTSP
jgi:hypothetical protein